MTPSLPSCFLRVMKSLLCFVLILLTSPAFAAMGTISGFLMQDNNQNYYVPMTGSARIPVRAVRPETIESLKKLKARDFFQGQGEIVSNVLILDSIDFVGLRRLLGFWSAEKSLLNFQDYSQVTIYHSFLDMGGQKDFFQYSIAPSTGNTWRIFFSDNSSVAAGSLVLGDEKAILKLYDASSGSVVQTVELNRISP